MANYFSILPASDSHIEFIHAHPDALAAYLEGVKPNLTLLSVKPTLWQRLTRQTSVALSPKLPTDWPTSECTLVGSEVNHRNVDLYHQILNGTNEFVTGGGTLFQTWLEPGNKHTHSAIDLTHGNQDFAFKSDQVKDIAERLSRVDLDMVRKGFTKWLQQKKEPSEYSDEECEYILKEFKLFAETTNQAVQHSQGLMVISN